MKEITLLGVTLQYETTYDSHELGEEARTDFYMGTTTLTKKKWVFYGPEYKETVPKKVFTIYADSQNVNLSKSWWREKITEKLEVMNRALELEKGELI